jgi:hypothetical protein
MAISPFNYRLDDHLNAGQSLWFLEKQILPTEADDDVANLSGGPLAAARRRDAAAVDSAAIGVERLGAGAQDAKAAPASHSIFGTDRALELPCGSQFRRAALSDPAGTLHFRHSSYFSRPSPSRYDQ